MKTGPNGLALIKHFEGLRRDAYQDSVGVWTIGYGHTAAAGDPKPRSGMKISTAEAEEILRRDLGQYEAAVSKALTRDPTQNQFDAMVSLCFNVGPGNFARSSIVRHLNDGNPAYAAQSFLKWNRAGGRVLAGLTRRREAEKALFLEQGSLTDKVSTEPLDPRPTAPPVTDAPKGGLLALIINLILAIFKRKG